MSRVTGRPWKKTPTAVSVARRLTSAEVQNHLRLLPEDIAFIDLCASGHPPRNAQAALKALSLKLDFTQRKPAQEIEVSEPQGPEVSDEEWERLSLLTHVVRRENDGE